jgi:hypothetical protein
MQAAYGKFLMVREFSQVLHPHPGAGFSVIPSKARIHHFPHSRESGNPAPAFSVIPAKANPAF